MTDAAEAEVLAIERRGAKAGMVRVVYWANRVAQVHGRGPLTADFVRAFEIVKGELERGEWPPKGGSE